MQRELATDARDLPHEATANFRTGVCGFCQRTLSNPLHLPIITERASEEPALETEKGTPDAV